MGRYIFISMDTASKYFTIRSFFAPDESFDYSVITLSQETLSNLNKEERTSLRRLGLKF